MGFVMESEKTMLWPNLTWVEISLWELKGENRRAKTGLWRVFCFLSKTEHNFLSEWQTFLKWKFIKWCFCLSMVDWTKLAISCTSTNTGNKFWEGHSDRIEGMKTNESCQQNGWRQRVNDNESSGMKAEAPLTTVRNAKKGWGIEASCKAGLWGMLNKIFHKSL